MDSIARRTFVGLLGIGGVAALSACSGPGSGTSSSSSSSPISTSLDTEAALSLAFTTATGSGLYDKLVELFMAKYPNVDVDLTTQSFDDIVVNAPRLVASTTPPDLIYLNSFGNLVKNGLLRNLDDYADAYGWSSWSPSQFLTTSSGSDGIRGEGSLYGAGPGFGCTGVFYNRSLAEKVGMSEPPASIEELESILATALDKGIVPFMSDGVDARNAYPLQNLLMAYASDPDNLTQWFYGNPEADIDNDDALEAVEKIVEWVDKGYFPSDINSLDSTSSVASFIDGTGLFYVDGNWDAPALDSGKAGGFGFFPFPSINEGDTRYSMAAATLLAIPQNAANPDVSAAFLNFVQTDADARQAAMDIGGLIPAGPSDAEALDIDDDTAVGQCAAAFETVLAEDGLVEFMANATSSMLESTLTPQIQLLFGGETEPKAFLEKLQSDFESVLES